MPAREKYILARAGIPSSRGESLPACLVRLIAERNAIIMAVPGTDDTQIPPEKTSAAAPVRPSWEAARPAGPRPASAPRSSGPSTPPYYAAPPAPTVLPPMPAADVSVLDPDVRYDLAGNPVPGTGTLAAPPGQVVYSSGPTAGTWPPPIASPYGPVGENGTDRVARLKWNWGAFLIPFWWSISNGQRGMASMIVLINVGSRWIPAPYDWGFIAASLGIQVYLGAMGHRLAWSSDRFGGDYDRFIRTQRAWMIWGFVLAALLIGAFIVAAVALPGFLAALSGPSPVHHHAYSNGDGANGYRSYGNGSSGSGQ